MVHEAHCSEEIHLGSLTEVVNEWEAWCKEVVTCVTSIVTCLAKTIAPGRPDIAGVSGAFNITFTTSNTVN